MPNRVQLPPLEKTAGEQFTAAAILDADLPEGVTISSVSVESATGLIISDEAPTSGVYVHDGRTYSAGRVFTYTVSGGTTGSTHFAVFSVAYSDGTAAREWSQPWVILDPEAP